MSVPVEYEVWTQQNCADYMQISKSTFARTIATRPDFPQRIQMFGHPRYAAADVIKWVINRRVA